MTEALRGERLVALREMQGLSQQEMAGDLGVSAAFLSQVGRAKKPLPEAVAVAASEKYRVPLSFFSVAPHPGDAGVATFLKSSQARARDEKRVVRLLGEAGRLFRHVSQMSGYHAASLPDPMNYNNDSERLAGAVRAAVSLTDHEPIINVTRLCERLGVGVVHDLDPEGDESSQHTALSMPSSSLDRPLIALTRGARAEDKRLAVAHELGHLIRDQDLDQPLRLRRDPREIAAHRFARALLVPEPLGRTLLSATLTLHGYLRVKAATGVGVRPLIHRAQDLEIITPDRARSLYIQWSSSGWNDAEPVEVADEQPLLLGQALRRVYGKSPAASASHITGVQSSLISQWVPTGDRASLASVHPLDGRRRAV